MWGLGARYGALRAIDALRRRRMGVMVSVLDVLVIIVVVLVIVLIAKRI